MSLPRDIQDFLQGYPGVQDNRMLSANLHFYSSELKCQPDHLLIDDLHTQWKGDYDTLEYNHGFIQWLFPIQEHGVNFRAQLLQLHEIESMKASPTVMRRLLTSYHLMLDFYGMRLLSEETGLLDSSLPPRNSAARYNNLIRHSHNNLRISRILKCLSEFGFEYLNAGFLLHVLNEQSERQHLRSRGIIDSMDRWWINCIRNQDERKWIRSVVQRVREGDFVFTRESYEAALQRRSETGSFKEERLDSSQ